MPKIDPDEFWSRPPSTSAARIQLVCELLDPPPIDGEPCEPLISRDDALAILSEAIEADVQAEAASSSADRKAPVP